MKVVIDIPEKYYNQYIGFVANGVATYTQDIIAKGLPLPKGHGDLIDRDVLIRKQFIPNVGWELVDLDDLKTSPTVIPADK